MREIKFRAWEKDVKNMVGWEDLDLWNLIGFFEEKNYIIMQYTGLKDKNGKEIYEGDIVTQHNKRKTRLGEINYEVIWYQEKCSFYLASMNDDGTERWLETPLSTGFLLEVIGNIYENPEILKQ